MLQLYLLQTNNGNKTAGRGGEVAVEWSKMFQLPLSEITNSYSEGHFRARNCY